MGKPPALPDSILGRLARVDGKTSVLTADDRDARHSIEQFVEDEGAEHAFGTRVSKPQEP